MPTEVNPKEKAMREMEQLVATVKIDTRKRKKWSIVSTESLLEWAKEHSIDETLTIEALATRWAHEAYPHIHDGTPVRIKPATESEKEMIAVWSGKEEEPDCEPVGF